VHLFVAVISQVIAEKIRNERTGQDDKRAGEQDGADFAIVGLDCLGEFRVASNLVQSGCVFRVFDKSSTIALGDTARFWNSIGIVCPVGAEPVGEVFRTAASYLRLKNVDRIAFIWIGRDQFLNASFECGFNGIASGKEEHRDGEHAEKEQEHNERVHVEQRRDALGRAPE